ncbi:hypothetical protein JHK86_018867 [Glycine max]|nr:hypothetical protein JHK86_018867 [Glycine max]
MLNPRASSSKPKRKRAEIQCSKLTIGKDEEKDVMKEEIASKDGILSIPMAYSPKNVRSPAIFIHDNASLKKRLVKKVFYKLIIMLRNFYFGLSYTSEKLVDIEEYVSVWTNDLSPVFVAHW